MKKRYIEPANEIIKLRFKQTLLTISGQNDLEGTSYGGGTEGNVNPGSGGDAREVISIPDAWNEW